MSRLLILGLAACKVLALPSANIPCIPGPELGITTTLVVGPVLISTYVASSTVLTFNDQISVTVTAPTQLSIVTATTETVIATRTM
jgi:hypothetical protein